MPSYSLSPAEAANHVLKRREIRRSLTEWSRKAGYEPALHHRRLIKELEALEGDQVALLELRCEPFDTLIVMMPPGAAKSTYVNCLYPSWLMARHPDRSVITASHGSELAEKWGRRTRNLVQQFGQVLGVHLAADSQAAHRWATTLGGEYYAVGVGVGIAGFRADRGIIDDPFGSREDAESEVMRDKIWDWYTDDLTARLKPHARQVIMHCMVGGTPVLMADGTERPLSAVRFGDYVATYDRGRVAASVVVDWRNQGPDLVFQISTISGKTVMANARHPFLVDRDGDLQWIKLKDLRVGEALLSVEARGKARSVPSTVASKKSAPKATAFSITTKPNGPAVIEHLLLRMPDPCLMPSLNIAMASRSMSTMHGSLNKADAVPSVDAYRRMQARQPLGKAGSASTIVMEQDAFEGFSATLATSPLSSSEQKNACNWPLSTYAVKRDAIKSIVFAGREDVFDVQIAGTENFIAGGLVSHNTRWHDDDLAGRKMRQMESLGRSVRVLKLPAEAQPNDPLGRRVGEMLWDEPAGYDYGGLLRLRKQDSDARTWSSLYQQDPVPPEGDYFRAEWLIPVEQLPPASSMRLYGGSDYAVTSDGGDFTVHAVVGVDPDDNPWLVDVWRQQASSDAWIDALADLVLRWRPRQWAEEQGQIRSGVGPFRDRVMRERRAWIVFEPFPTRGDKAVRAQSIRGYIAQHGLRIPAAAPWRNDVLRELLRFPFGEHDDIVDALGLVGQLLDKVLRGVKPLPRPAAPPRIGYTATTDGRPKGARDVNTI